MFAGMKNFSCARAAMAARQETGETAQSRPTGNELGLLKSD